MIQSLEIELTANDIVILTDLIYEQAPRLWIEGEWYCPHCLESNSNALDLIQSYYNSARNDEATAESFAPCESLAKEYRAAQDYERDA